MNRISTILRQRELANTPEGRAVSQAALMRGISVDSLDATQLEQRRLSLQAGTALPVGSVEFVRTAMKIAGTTEPPNMSYPEVLQPFLQRSVWRSTVGEALGDGRDLFMKPAATKAFTGFVLRPGRPGGANGEHDQQQLMTAASLPQTEPVWLSEPVRFLCEWRFYVRDGLILGSARYDPEGADDAPQPSLLVVEEAIQAMSREPRHRAYALDFGVMEDGRTALVEANDFWALGLYGRAVPAQLYLDALQLRWLQILQSPA